MHRSVEQLLRVQDVDSQIIFLREAIGARPQELNDDRVKVRQGEETLAALEASIKRARVDADTRELDIKGFDAEITKLKIALNTARSNDEYSVFRDGIERQEGLRGEAEEEVLVQLTEIDALNEDKERREAELAAVRKILDRKESELKELLGELGSQLEGHERRRAELIEGIDPEHLTIYNRVLERHQNFAISVVEDQICRGCHMRVTAQNVNLLMQNLFVQCTCCTRLLRLDS